MGVFGGSEKSAADHTVDRIDWRGYVPISAAKLAAILPPQAHDMAGAFVEAAEEYNLNALFLAAISQLETASWTSFAYRTKHNAMGISDANGTVVCKSTANSVQRMAKLLSSTVGPYRTCRSLKDVWYVYSPPSFEQPDGKPVSNDPNDTNKGWGPGVLACWNRLDAAMAG